MSPFASGYLKRHGGNALLDGVIVGALVATVFLIARVVLLRTSLGRQAGEPVVTRRVWVGALVAAACAAAASTLSDVLFG